MSVQNKNRFECPVCGYSKLSDVPREGEICPSCGTQFDSEGFDLAYPKLRERWIDRGMPWFSRGKGKPKDWSPFHQLIIAGYGVDLIQHKRMQTDEGYRYAVDEAFSDVRIGIQLKAIRELGDESLTQSELARLADMKQSRISELESMEYASWSISTLRRLAKALGVRLAFAFEAWHELRPELDDLTPEKLWKPSFDKDRGFHYSVGALTLTDSVGDRSLAATARAYDPLTTEIPIRKPTVKAPRRDTAEGVFNIAA
jgi:transcriptional regulator with XRE-family HTH domain